MTKLNLKAVKLTAWISIGYCVLLACYYLYDIIFREYSWQRAIPQVAPEYVRLIITCFIVIFMIKILRGVTKQNQVFIPNNYRWLIYSAICLFIEPFTSAYAVFYTHHYTLGEEIQRINRLELILAPTLHPQMIPSIIAGLIILMVAYLYKLGAQAAEEQRLTI